MWVLEGAMDLRKENKIININFVANFILLIIFILNSNNIYANQKPDLTSIWDIKLGMSYEDIPSKDFMFFACGTDGGPPGKPLKNKFAGYNECKEDKYGLREVYFEYDDEAYYWALAYNDAHSSAFQGTRVFSHLSILSVLFDKNGFVQGIKIITDDRAAHSHRKGAPGLFLKLEGTFGKDVWECNEFEPSEGEIPVGESFMKKLCIKEKFDKTIFLRGDYYRKKGQTTFDTVTKKPTTGYFESRTRLEVYSNIVSINLDEYDWNE